MKKPSEFAVLLGLNPLFSKLGDQVLERLASLCSRRRLAEGEVLFKKGDKADALYGIRRGAIRVETGSEDGVRLILNVFGAGDVFGEIASLDGGPRTADAIASEDCELLLLRRNDLLSLLEREPQVAVRLIELLCQRIRSTSERMEEVSFLPLQARMARRLSELAKDFGAELDLTQNELSTLVGGARESVSRQLQKWRRLGIVALRRGRIIIVDANRLQFEARQTE
jgi:CRP/FNR family cyclic AMP-dependent transcriptional regulator